jgi:hypothetical protein
MAEHGKYLAKTSKQRLLQEWKLEHISLKAEAKEVRE